MKLPFGVEGFAIGFDRKTAVTAAVLLGLVIGGGAFILVESNAPSYLHHGPEACLNCHVMNPHYATWKNSSHSRHAVCIDCHLPHGNIIATYLYKGMVGTRDMEGYLRYREHEAIRLQSTSPFVIEQNCRRCHEGVVEAMSPLHGPVFQKEAAAVRCWDCHRDVPHTSISSLSSTSDITAPDADGPNTALWMRADPSVGNHLLP